MKETSVNDFRLSGLCAATITPFDKSGRLRLEQIDLIVDQLIQNGVTGLYVCGSTGEGVSLTDDERRSVADAYVKASSGRVPVVVHVGQNSLKAAGELAAHAQTIGADAISATCPSYFNIDRLDTLVAAMTNVATNAPDLPFYYYHIPARTGVNFDMVDFLRQAAPKNPNLVGLKFTFPVLHQYQQCLEMDNGKFDILWGVDEMLLGALATGATGAIGSTYNIAAPVYLRIIEAFEQRDMQQARRWQSRAIAFISLLASFQFLPALREVLKLQGLDCGPCRLPQGSLTNGEMSDLKAKLEAINFFDWCSAGDSEPHFRPDTTENDHAVQPT